MSKKIRFPLEMKDGVKVRSLEELKENFDLEKVINYFIDGRIITWLRDRYYIDEAEKLEKLDLNSSNFKSNICNIFDVNFIEKNLNVKELENKKQRLLKLKQYTDNEKVIINVDKVAFNQEELLYLLSKGISTIYLCNNEFDIPLTKENITYIGVNECTVKIDSKEILDFQVKKIRFQSVKFNEEYTKLIQQNIDLLHPIEYKTSEIGKCFTDNYEFKECEKIFYLLKNELKEITFEIDIYTKYIVEILSNRELEKMFDKF